MNSHKARGMERITSDIIKLGGQIVFTYLTNIFNSVLKTKQIPDSWYEAKIVIMSKKGIPRRHQKPYKPPVKQLQNIHKTLAN